MARVINLSLPFYPHMPVGNVWPHDPPFRTEQIISYASHGARIDYISLHSESGTRMMTRGTNDPSAPRIGERDLGEMVDLPAVVINIPKGVQEEITARDIEAQVVGDPAYRPGDALLIRTGWGDGERYRTLGDDYAIQTPHFSDDGSLRLAEAMREKQTDLLAIDVAYIGNLAPYHMRPEWVDLPPWLRPPFPSKECQIYMQYYNSKKGLKDWSASRPLHKAGIIIAGLCNTGAIIQKRVRLTALPLYVDRAPGAPVTVVAIEDIEEVATVARLLNLTLPIYPNMPVGNVWAYDVPFQMEPIRTWERTGAQLEYYQFHSETGTRLMMRATYDPEAPKVGDLDLGRLLDRETVVIDIPKGAQEEITARDIDERVAADPAYRPGDALLIRTGWGDGERCRTLGDDYAIQTPHFSDDGSLRLAALMREKQTDLLAIDVAYIGNCGRTYMLREWVALPPWQRPSWPSEQAKIYLRYYTKEKIQADWSASRPLHEAGIVLAALANTGAIRTKRVLLTAFPLFVQDAPGAPATVIAKEIQR